MSRYDEYYAKTVKLFSSCESVEKRKKLYHELVKKYHTDYNPNVDLDLIKAINDAYHLDYDKMKTKKSQGENTTSSPQKPTESFRHPKTPLKTEAEVDEEIRFYQCYRNYFVNEYLHFQDKMNILRNDLMILKAKFFNAQTSYLFYKRQYEKDVNNYSIVKFPNFFRPFAKLYQIGKNKYPNAFPLISTVSMVTLCVAFFSQFGFLFFVGVGVGTISFEAVLHFAQQNSWLDDLKRLKKRINSNQIKCQHYGQQMKDNKNEQNQVQKELLHYSFEQNILQGKIDQCDAFLYDLFCQKESFSKSNEKYRNSRENRKSDSHQSSKTEKDTGYQKRKKYNNGKGGQQ